MTSTSKIEEIRDAFKKIMEFKERKKELPPHLFPKETWKRASCIVYLVGNYQQLSDRAIYKGNIGKETKIYEVNTFLLKSHNFLNIYYDLTKEEWMYQTCYGDANTLKSCPSKWYSARALIKYLEKYEKEIQFDAGRLPYCIYLEDFIE